MSLSCLSRYDIRLRRVTRTLERGKRVQSEGGASESTSPSPESGLNIPPSKVYRGDSWHTHSSIISTIIYQTCVLCLAPGPTLKMQKWRLHKKVSLGAWGFPENGRGAEDQEMFWFPQEEWTGFLKLPASWFSYNQASNQVDLLHITHLVSSES